jgi:hypothetical protein
MAVITNTVHRIFRGSSACTFLGTKVAGIANFTVIKKSVAEMRLRLVFLINNMKQNELESQDLDKNMEFVLKDTVFRAFLMPVFV